jgi:hypothetical protein
MHIINKRIGAQPYYPSTFSFPLMAKRRPEILKFRKVRNMRNIIRPCPKIKRFDQICSWALPLTSHDLRNILHSAFSICSTLSTTGISSKRLKLNDFSLTHQQSNNSISLQGITHSTPKRLKIALYNSLAISQWEEDDL